MGLQLRDTVGDVHSVETEFQMCSCGLPRVWLEAWLCLRVLAALMVSPEIARGWLAGRHCGQGLVPDCEVRRSAMMLQC
jgi:hypothetical protein